MDESHDLNVHGGLPVHGAMGAAARAFEAISILVCLALIGYHTAAAAVYGAFDWRAPICFVAGVICADFLSGLIHWGADSYFTVTTPFVGRRLVWPFRVHHVNPDDFLTRDFVDANGDVAGAAVPFLLLAFVIPIEEADGLAALCFLLGLTAVGCFVNQFHQWAHMKSAPRPIRWLQRRGLVLSRAHLRHHQEPFATDYCIVTGWCNPMLNRVGFFRRLEALIHRLTGWVAREDDQRFYETVRKSDSRAAR